MFNCIVSSNLCIFLLKKNGVFLFNRNFISTSSNNLNIFFYSSICYNCFLPFDVYAVSEKGLSRVYSTFFFYNSDIFLKVYNSFSGIKSSSYLWIVNTWYEREVMEFSNVSFVGCSDCRSLLLPYSYINNNFVYKFSSQNTYALKYSTSRREVLSLCRFDTVL